jgi:DNA-nicking Smr family endonuclease
VSRKRRRAQAEPGQAPQGAAFAALAGLKTGRPGAPSPPRKPAVSPQTDARDASAAADEDASLFRRAVGEVQAVSDGGRAELATPKPPPLPRTPAADESVADDDRRPTGRPRTVDDAALFREAMEGVAQLRDSGRIEPGGPLPLPLTAGTDPGGAGETPFRADALPSSVDPDDPSALFRYAAGGAQPLPPTDRIEPDTPAPPPLPRKRAEDDQAVLREALEAPLSFEDRLDMGDEAAFLRPGLPRRVLTDLRRGRWVVQGEIDLHGMVRDEARASLTRFLAFSLQRGRRCVRVIHGKGLRSPGGVGILKQLSRGWLAQREEILAFCQARPHDGGSGALLVLLRAGTAAPEVSGT